MGKKLIVFTLIVFFTFPLLFADEVEDKILSALDQLKQGDTEKTIEFLSEAIMLINNKKELKIREIILCSDVQDFRDYTKKPGKSIKAGEPLLLYIEPEGFRVVKENDSYKIKVSEDISITDEKGNVIIEKKDWIIYEKGFPTPTIPFYITNHITDIPVGKYKFNLTLKDHNKKSFIAETYQFVVE